MSACAYCLPRIRTRLSRPCNTYNIDNADNSDNIDGIDNKHNSDNAARLSITITTLS